MGELVPGMCADLTTVFDLPCAFFGYSLGALIAFEVARSLRWANLPPLRHLFLAAKGSPRLKPPHPPRSSMSDEELLFELKRIGGMREAVLQDRELLELFLPILRADFALNDHYQYKSSEPLSCPVTVFGGTADREVPLPALMDWELETRSSFSLVEVPGDHFFLHSHTKLIQEQILRKLSPSDT
jgi:medium-chain acyl-[acyl-carrier-protein] hydrolase